MDVQRETIIPRHYCVAGVAEYKNHKKLKIHLMKIIEASVKGMIKEHKKTGYAITDRKKEKKIRFFSLCKKSCLFSLFHRKETDT